MMVIAEIKTDNEEITIEMSDYGSYYFGQDDSWIEFTVKEIPQLIAALNEIMEHQP